MNILAIAASQREHSLNRQLLAFAAQQATQAANVQITLLDYAQIIAPCYDDSEVGLADMPPAIHALVEQLASHDALMIATPEYNWSFPGHLKNIIDWVSCLRPCPFSSLPTLLLSASPSRRGGMPGLMQLQQVLASQMTPVYPRFFALGQAHELLDGNPTLEDAALSAELRDIVTGFIAFAQRLNEE